jgi:hypothetical protein
MIVQWKDAHVHTQVEVAATKRAYGITARENDWFFFFWFFQKESKGFLFM